MSYADKQLIPVTVKKTVENPNNPHVPFEFFVDFAGDAEQTLSEYYGKNIRQGNAFKLKRIDMGIQPLTNDGADYDVGLAVQGQGVFTPCTKHTRKAWNQLFTEWKKQKSLRGAVGGVVRYDDFELAWNDAHAAAWSRVSTLHAGGIGDTDTEKLCIQGSSVTGQFLSLKDYYERRNPILPPSQFPLGGGVVKEPKFDTYWPENAELQVSASNSAVVTEIGGLANDAYSGGNVMQTAWEGNSNIFLGSMHWYLYVTPEDTDAQLADKAEVTMTFWIESWKPMVYAKKSRMTRKKNFTRRAKASGRRKSSRRYKRRY